MRRGPRTVAVKRQAAVNVFHVPRATACQHCWYGRPGCHVAEKKTRFLVVSWVLNTKSEGIKVNCNDRSGVVTRTLKSERLTRTFVVPLS